MADLINPFNSIHGAPTSSSRRSDDTARQDKSKSDQNDLPDDLKARVVYDTVELSDGAKQVNLARGFDLADQVRNEKDPEKVQELLRTGQEDIKRISELFREVFADLGSLFGARRR